jgi:hypothetical protein
MAIALTPAPTRFMDVYQTKWVAGVSKGENPGESLDDR